MSTGPTPALPEAAAQTYVGERAIGQNQAPLPSQIIDVRNADTVAREAPQQAATEPGSGKTVEAEETSGKLPFKKKVEAWAHIHHGTITRNMDEKHEYQEVLAGERPPPEKPEKE